MKRKIAQIIALVVAITVSLAGCTSKPTEAKTPWLGGYNYQASMAWIGPISNGDGDMLEYREVLELEGFVTHTGLPIVLCVRQNNDYAASTVIPQMESWAYSYRDKANFVFADANDPDGLLQSLEFTITPTFYLLHKGAIIMYASWQEANALKLLEEALLELMAQQGGNTA